MAKNRNKKKLNSSAMEIATDSLSDAPQAMDTSELGVQDPDSDDRNLKVKKGRPMKRTKNVRKKKSVAKAIAKNEQSVEKVVKNESKKMRIQSAKLLTQLSTESMIKFVLQSWGENQFLNLKKFLRLFVEKDSRKELMGGTTCEGRVTAVENYPLAVTKGQPTPQATKDGKKDKGWRDL
ncbi:hypothetical protein L484_018744 [Morus notabilis]|uniref:Uncharacterized protein n=1 Tax=Morus notabilis TaxID=981085 RepID=W9RGP3_9ROSA|nr:hypothetical protein L484_018744 [Morus notabilis]